MSIPDQSTTQSHAESPRRRRGLAAAVVAALLVIVVVILVRRAGAPAERAGVVAALRPRAADTVVTLDSMALRLAGVTVVTVLPTTTDEVRANGTIVYDADRLSVVAPRAEGRIVSVRTDLGREVAAGDVLAIIESPEVGQTRGDLERARATVSVSKRNYEREKRLFEQEISPEKEMLDAEVVYRTAEADVNGALAKLQTYGATSGVGGNYGLRTAVAGTVVERNASPGQIVGATSNVFTVADLRHVWMVVDVYEADLQRVHRGAAVRVSSPALPGETFDGRVAFAGGVVDSLSRTIKLRVSVENASKRLRPGMFAQVRIAAPVTGPATQVIALPEVAVQDLNGTPVVFVQTGAGQFVARRVVVGIRGADGTVVISNGVRSGERVVVQGAFQLKAELLKATVGGGE